MPNLSKPHSELTIDSFLNVIATGEERFSEDEYIHFVASFPHRIWVNGPVKCGNNKIVAFVVHYLDALHGKVLGPLPRLEMDLMQYHRFKAGQPAFCKVPKYRKERLLQDLADPYGRSRYLLTRGVFLTRSHGVSGLRKKDYLSGYHPILQSCKGLFPIRHPLDMAVSWYHHRMTKERENYPPISEYYMEPEALEEFANQLGVWNQLLTYRGLVVRYEDWLTQEEVIALDILRYLELPIVDWFVSYALAESSVERAQQKEKVFMETQGQEHLSFVRQYRPQYNLRTHIRDGSKGQWVETLSPEAIANLAAIARQCGLEALYPDLNDVPSASAELVIDS
jgi:hypothetical protein